MMDSKHKNTQDQNCLSKFFAKELKFKIKQFIEMYVKYKVKAIPGSWTEEKNAFYEVEQFQAKAYITKKAINEFDKIFGDKAYETYISESCWHLKESSESKALKCAKKLVYRRIKESLFLKEQFKIQVPEERVIYHIENFLHHYVYFYHQAYDSQKELYVLSCDLVSAEEVKAYLGIDVVYANDVKKKFFTTESKYINNVDRIVREMAQIIHSSIVQSEE